MACSGFGAPSLVLLLLVALARPALAQEPGEPAPEPGPDAPTEPAPPAEPAPEPPASEPPAPEPVPEPAPPAEPAPAEPSLPADPAPAPYPPAQPADPEPAPAAPGRPPSAAYPPAPSRAPESPTPAPAPAPTTAARPTAPAPAAPSSTPAPSAPASSGAEFVTDYDARKKEKEKDKRAEQNQNGLLGPIRLGPVVGVGLPNLVSFGAQLKLTRFLAGGINVGLIPKARIAYYGEATLWYQEYDLYGRLHPFGGAFFLGAGVGYESVEGTLVARHDISQYQALDPSLPALLEIRSAGSVETLVLTPQIGFFKTFKPGFSIGFDVGAQVPIAPSDVKFSTDVPSGVPQPVRDLMTRNDDEVRDTLKKIGQTPLPTFNLRIGWLL